MMRMIPIGLVLLWGGAALAAVPTEVSFQQTANTTPRPAGAVVPSVVGLPGSPPAQPAPTPATARPGGVFGSPPAAGRPPQAGAQAETAAPVAAPPQTTARPPSRPTPRGAGFRFANASIEEVVKAVMDELKYPYILDPRVSGTVNVFTQGEVPRDKLLPILEQILNLNGQAIVKQGEFYVVLPLASSAQIPGAILKRPPAAPVAPPAPPPSESGTARESGAQSPPPAEEGSGVPAAGQEPPQTPPGPTILTVPSSQRDEALEQQEGVITYIIPLHYLPSSEMVTMIKAFISDGAQIVDFQSANTLIITDYRANIKQALRLIELLDTQYFDLNTVDLVPIRYNKAQDIAEDLGKIFAPGDKAGGVRIVAIERLNSLLLVTHSPAVFAEAKRWIDKLDAPSSSSNVKTFVYQVENNTAANIAEILAQLYEDGTGLPSGPTVGEEGQDQQQQPSRRREAGFLPEGSQQRNQSIGPSLGGRSAQSGVRAVVSGNVKIIVNEFNNSLIIQGSEADYDFLSQTIRQLDVLPRQVLIEAEIYSVELRDDLSYGVGSFLQARGSTFPPGDNGGGTTEGSLPPPTLGSISGGTLSATTRIFLGGERQVGLLLNALRSRTNVEILESPSLLVIDGTEAQINVGAEVPVSTTSFSDPLRSGDTAFVNSIQFRPTGTTLLLQPRISYSGIVTMDLAVEVSSATGGGASGLTPTINRNFVQTSMIAKDNETIMIAGIISDSFTLGRDRVPLLGDIPILGALFGQTSRNKRRFELLFLITPRVIRNLPTAVELTLDFKRALTGAYQFIDQKKQERQELIDRHLREELERQERMERHRREALERDSVAPPPPADQEPPRPQP